MASSYPDILDNLATTHADGTNEVIHATTVNDLADAVNKIEAAIGVNPHGTSLPETLYADLTTRVVALDVPTVKNVTPPYTLVLGDMACILNCNNVSAANLTIPPHSSVALPVGVTIMFRQGYAGPTTVVGGAGVTIRSRGSAVITAGLNAMFSATQIATDDWTLAGDLV